MNKQTAWKEAREETRTWGTLKRLVKVRRKNGMSAVNPAFTLEQACGIYERAIADRDDNETPKAWCIDPYTGCEKASADFLIVANILRDCA